MSRVSLKAVAANAALAVAALSLAASGDEIAPPKAGPSLDDLVKVHGLGKGAKGFAGKFDIVKTSRGNERAMAARLAKDPRVENAEPNYTRQPLAVSPRLWQIANPGGLNMKFNEKDTGGRYGQTLPSTYASLADADMDADFAVP